MRGLEKFRGDLSKVSSVASFFVSRVDTVVDRGLQANKTEEASELLGKVKKEIILAFYTFLLHFEKISMFGAQVAISQSKLAYQIYKKKISEARWKALEERGANPQRLLWASTGVKNPSYRDTLYVDSLIGPQTVS